MITAIDIADAVVNDLAAGVSLGHFAIEFTPTRRLVVRLELDEMDADLHVAVVPAESTIAIANRALTADQFQIDVGVQQRISDESAADALMLLLNQIAKFFFGKRVGTTGAAWIGSEFKPIFSVSHLDTENQFIGIVRLTFRLLQ